MIMAGVPEGVLSFIYHVTYDVEFNERFNKDEEEVMEFFQIPLRLKEVIREISETERKKSDDLKKLRNEAKKKKATRELSDRLTQEEEAFMKRNVVPPAAMKIVLEAIQKELNGGVYRRFW
jgi:hypothetical protein